MNKPYFPMIDVLRGFAAISVIVAHTIFHANWTDFPDSGPLYWFRQGAFGVDLFFVISGFVIMHGAAEMIDRAPHRMRRRFMARRLARIVPLYFLTLIVALVTIDRGLLSAPGVALHHLAAHVLFLHTFDPNLFSSINGPNWSVGIEMHFYLLMALVAPLFLSRWKWALLAAFLVVGLVWRYQAFASMPGAENYPLFVRSVWLPGRLDAFALGIAMALFVRTERFKRIGEIWALPTAALAVASLYYYFQWVWATGNPAIDFASSRLLVAIPFALLILAAILIRSELLYRISRPFRYLGEISYGLYLWHLIVLLSVNKSDWSPEVIFLVTLTATTVISAASWHLFEQPIIARARRGSAPVAESSPVPDHRLA